MTTPNPNPGDLPDRYRSAWEEFDDWCTARHLPSWPAPPGVVVAYLVANPKSPATQRGRVTAINAAHRRAGLPAPGRAEAVRELYNPARAARRARTRTAVDAVLTELPVSGWVRGLFGRRDAVLLTLAAAGLSFPRLAGLRQEQIQVTDTAVIVDDGMLVLPARPDESLLCPVQILRRWAAVTNLAPRGYGHAILAEQLTENTLAPADFDSRWATQPLLTAFDAYGYPAGHAPIGRLHPLHPTTAAAIAAAHLSGNPRRHRNRPRTAPVPEQVPAPPVVEPIDLDPGYYDRGVAARWRDRPAHDELDDLLDALEVKIRETTAASASLLDDLA
ncbi:recombinase [Nocardia sp. NPDC003963]